MAHADVENRLKWHVDVEYQKLKLYVEDKHFA